MAKLSLRLRLTLMVKSVPYPFVITVQLLIAFVTYGAYGQEKNPEKQEIQISNEDLQNVDRELIKKKAKDIVSDSISSRKENSILEEIVGNEERLDPTKLAQHAYDSLSGENFIKGSLERIIPKKKIYSEKFLKKISDSLRENLDINAYRNLVKNPQAFGDKDLLEAVNKKFPAFPDQSKYVQDANALKKSTSKEALPSVSDLLNHDSISGLKVPDHILAELPPLPGSQLKTKYLSALDSLRSLKLKQEKLLLKEEKISDHAKAALFRKKPGFWDKTYFEGIVGVLNGEESITVVNISPSLGYKITNTFSLGIGPALLLKADHQNISTSGGMRTFLKTEFFHGRVYTQIENLVGLSKSDPIDNIEKKTTVNNTVSVGGGGLFPLSKTLSLNLLALYKLTGRETQLTGTSPWEFRIGLSLTKRRKQKTK